jgi:hypothetical protein
MRRFPPPPPEFAEEFARGGWERVELLYGARTDCLKKWIAMTGAKTRRVLRRESAEGEDEPAPISAHPQ